MRKRKKRAKSGLPSGTYVLRELYVSPAYLALGGFAPQLLMLFLGKRDLDERNNYECRNKNNITMTYAELENIHNAYSNPNASRFFPKGKGISRPRIIRAFDDLLSKGFLRIVKQGGKAKHDKTIYGLSEDWRLWSEGVTIAKRERETRTLGYINKRQKKTNIANVSVPLHANENVPIPAHKAAPMGNENVPMEKECLPLCGAA